jgi:hypothetical protein
VQMNEAQMTAGWRSSRCRTFRLTGPKQRREATL